MEKPILIKDLGMMYPTETSKQKSRYGIFICDCGNEFKTVIRNVTKRSTLSCGCLQNKTRLVANFKHGNTNKRLFRIYNAMKRRCSTNSYYMQKNISICKEWINSFDTFEIWALENGYDDLLTIDRIDNDGNYEPSNCRWATKSVQSRNTRLLKSTNTSGYRGVSYYAHYNNYTANIAINSKQIRLGYFKTAIEAAKAYNDYVIDNNLEHTLNII